MTLSIFNNQGFRASDPSTAELRKLEKGRRANIRKLHRVGRHSRETEPEAGAVRVHAYIGGAGNNSDGRCCLTRSHTSLPVTRLLFIA